MLSHAALVELLWDVGACDPAREWTERQVGTKPSELWRQCPRPDWLIWFAHTVGIERAHIIGVLGDALELARPHMIDSTSFGCPLLVSRIGRLVPRWT